MNATNTEKPLVVVTGYSGLIGTSLVEALDKDYRFVGLDIQSPDWKDVDAAWIKCDLTDDESVSKTLDQLRHQFGASLAGVVHLAAYYDFSGEPSPLYEKLTVEGTRRLLRQLQSFEVEQLLFSSTLLVMKSSEDDQPVTASSPLKERVVVNDRFHIKPLLPLLHSDGRFFVLALSQDHARLYEATRCRIRELELPALETAGREDREESLQLYSHQAPCSCLS